MKTNILKRLSALAMTAVMAFSISGGVSAADAATATVDTGRSTSLTLYKYDLTGAENDGVWDSQSYVSTGIADEQVNTALSQYAIQGVEFTYRKLADLSIYKGTAADGHQETVPLYAFTENTKSGSKETIDFLSALGLTTNDAYRTDHDGKQNRVWYFKCDVLIEALDHALQTNSTSTKDALEKYMATNGGTAMPETDENGYSKVDGLAQGLYLLVETRVPENVISTTAPFLVSLPMTTVDGSAWNYDLTLYPKNETGNPTLEKTVRESKADTGKNAGKTDDITDGYHHIATASDGDVVEYQVISTLPTITSSTTALTTYTFVDSLSMGIQYNKGDVKIEFFKDAACTDRVAVWNEQDGKFTTSYTDYSSESGSQMTISMTADGLAEINSATTVYDPATSLLRGYSNLTMRITYACTVNSDASVIYGDSGNPNDVTLTWKRTNTEYYDVSELLGKETIESSSHGKTKGRSGSYSTNYQQTGRELLTPDEVRMLDNQYALLFLRGERPVMDKKYNILRHPYVKLSTDGSGAPYLHGTVHGDTASVYLTAMQEIKQEKASADKETTTYELLSSDELEAQIFKEEPK